LYHLASSKHLLNALDGALIACNRHVDGSKHYIIVLLDSVARSDDYVSAGFLNRIVGSGCLDGFYRVGQCERQCTSAVSASRVGNAVCVFSLATQGEEQNLGCSGLTSDFLAYFDVSLDVGRYGT